MSQNDIVQGNIHVNLPTKEQLEQQKKQYEQEQGDQQVVDRKFSTFQNLKELDECLEWLHKQRKISFDCFEQITKIGNQITKLAKEESLNKLDELLEENIEYVDYLTPYIDDAFDQVLTLRFDNVIKFFLERGYDISKGYSECLITLTKTARLLKMCPPTQTLELLLQYGADINQIEQIHGKWRTALHLAAKYGLFEFVVTLVNFKGCEINPVDGKKMTPLGYAKQKIDQGKQYKKIVAFLEDRGGVVDWKNSFR
ncbi:Ankyrin repeat-containing domain [Pseudocohnilembus persalinus]|uniref:Ankyrin repeat-containing domain n=1 Tax=Pseudocohnilembus persalinus TaxID=266149 RepID=A0A0V0QAW6_PSEPJ|nr:Ankyrin repeat-containing domain [Pseudocohnilembus persalinus]|eukprot:KRW99369.1 Ankyrin repeat-containing domain [Pseudocohnilembus persalinus]